MIIWLASYPKSGNTWVRSLLSAYLYTNNGLFNFYLLNKIKQFPDKRYFESFTTNFEDIKTISDYWIAAQTKINLADKIIFLKTHSALCTVENNPFTNRFNTKAAIYIVRDPRNVITSLSHHYSLSINESLDFITDKKRILVDDDDFGIATFLGDWAENYKSWRNLNFAPLLIIKYEDLITDAKKTFILILNFLSKFMNIKIDNKKIENVINSCSFDRLAEKEKIEGFKESIFSKKYNKNLKFFNLGQKNDWKNLLDYETGKEIKKEFYAEMKELNYY